MAIRILAACCSGECTGSCVSPCEEVRMAECWSPEAPICHCRSRGKSATTANEVCAANAPSVCQCDIPAVFREACIKACTAHFVLAISITRAKQSCCLVTRLPSGLLDSESETIPVGSAQEAALPTNTAGKDS